MQGLALYLDGYNQVMLGIAVDGLMQAYKKLVFTSKEQLKHTLKDCLVTIQTFY